MRQQDITFQNLSPILLFVYNRPWHTKRTVEALKKNEFARQSDLFVYSDNAKCREEEETVNEVREYINQISGFKAISIIERKRNWGLVDNITRGVMDIVERYGKVIVLEDDVVTSPLFLRYMNRALNAYQDEKSVWHISGWNVPVDYWDMPDTFFWRVMNCYGWATWADRWQYYERDPKKLISEFSSEDIHSFNLEGAKNFWRQIVKNAKGKTSTWAIFWYATIFQNNGLCLNPSHSYVKNMGFDGSGMHCKNSDHKINDSLCQKADSAFPKKIEESPLAVEKIKEFYRSEKKPLVVRAIKKVKEILPLK